MRTNILVLNAGSSSLKFGLFDGVGRPARRWALGAARAQGEATTTVTIADDAGLSTCAEPWPGLASNALVARILAWAEARGKIGAVGHRIVHGGTEFGDPVVIDKSILRALDDLAPLAPLHQQAGIAPARAIAKSRPGLVQVACFDTAFHRTIEPPASLYGLPPSFARLGIRRYGFHGLSFQSIAAQLQAVAPRDRNERIIVAHLGSGASLCALRDLKSIDTTMGFSTLDGLMMGTRPGSLDPGILLYLLRSGKFTAEQLEDVLYRRCGLLGVSGLSADIRILLASPDPAAARAVDLFVFQAVRQAAALAATLGGLDRFVFTGGIGEGCAAIRARIVDGLTMFGAMLDEPANRASETCISAADSAVRVEVRPTREEQVIADAVSSLR